MLYPEETYTFAEIKATLLGDGLEEGSEEFREALSKRFQFVAEDVWIEQSPSSRKPRVYSTDEVDQILRAQGIVPDLDERCKLFTPHQIGGDGWIRREDSPYLQPSGSSQATGYDVT